MRIAGSSGSLLDSQPVDAQSANRENKMPRKYRRELMANLTGNENVQQIQRYKPSGDSSPDYNSHEGGALQ